MKRLISFLEKHYIYFFKRKEFEADLKRRKGKCLQCGKCCESHKCPFLKNNLCIVYNTWFRNTILKVLCLKSPYSKRINPNRITYDIKDCGYYWK